MNPLRRVAVLILKVAVGILEALCLVASLVMYSAGWYLVYYRLEFDETVLGIILMVGCGAEAICFVAIILSQLRGK